MFTEDITDKIAQATETKLVLAVGSYIFGIYDAPFSPERKHTGGKGPSPSPGPLLYSSVANGEATAITLT